MFELPDIMRVAQQMARHSGARQVVLAENVANADTPGYRARDLPEFGAMLRAGTLDRAALERAPVVDRNPVTRAPNGNTVSVEDQMMRAAQTRQSHDLALAVYSSARNILRTALGK
ncbi:MAG: flagellar basal body protein [Roseinatronobacter sp.]